LFLPPLPLPVTGSVLSTGVVPQGLFIAYDRHIKIPMRQIIWSMRSKRRIYLAFVDILTQT
jgi:hypothetical protein